MENDEFPEHIEGHRGPRGGTVFCQPGHPGRAHHHYIRADVVNARLTEIAKALRNLKVAAGMALGRLENDGEVDDATEANLHRHYAHARGVLPIPLFDGASLATPKRDRSAD